MIGTVRAYDPVRCFGFIIGEDGADYFVHRSDVTGPVLVAGEQVSFDPERTLKGLRACMVRRVASSTGSPA